MNIVVIFGGKSVEHEISVITGVLTLNSVDKTMYNVIPVYITKEGKFVTSSEMFTVESFINLNEKLLKEVAILGGDNKLYYKKNKKLKEIFKIDCIINCCHGGFGEDGSLSGMFNICGIPSASPDILGASIAMDKGITKLICKGLGVKIVPSFKILECDYKERKLIALKYIINNINLPVIIKPSRLGSSVGISIARTEEQLVISIENAFVYDETVIVEKFLENKEEVNCAAFCKEGKICVSECEKANLKEDFLTFENKYMERGKSLSQFPAKISKKSYQKIQSITKILYKKLNLNGVVRADFLISGDEVYFNELNTVPGSLAYYLFCDDVADFKFLVEDLIVEGIEKFNYKNSKKTIFEDNILNKIELDRTKRMKK